MNSKKIKIGLALGGGSALGFAHIGVLKALEENDISIDYISGTSAGAIAGALYAFSVSFKDIEQEAEKLDWKKLAKLKPSTLGITSNVAFKEILEKYIGNVDIANAKIPLAIVTTDIESGEKIVFRKGSVVDTVLASSCLPGLFSPVEINKFMLVDGGIIENVPIPTLKDFNPDITIGVNLLRHRRYTRPKNVIGVLINSFDMINHRISAQPRQEDANIIIEPDLSNYSMTDIKKWKEISDIGYRETLKYISAIKELQTPPISNNFWKFVKKIFKK